MEQKIETQEAQEPQKAQEVETRTKPILYSFRRCPYAMRARLAIASAELACELREIILSDKPAHMLTLSPKGTVPVLWLTDGQILEESLDIMYWALQQNDPENLLAYEDAENLIAENDKTFTYHLTRYKYAERYEGEDPFAHRAAGAVFLDKLNKQLDGKLWLFAETPKLVDFALLPFVRQYRIADMDWFDKQTQWAGLHVWLQNFLHSTRFAQSMQKYDLWQDGTQGIDFPPVATP